MTNILIIGEILVATLLIVVILLQRQGGGLSSVLGGGGETYRTKRGFEKTLVWATIVLSVLLLVLAIARIIV
ncbi:MAG: preprotein translocase subunit SecG [Candidatus Paceibacterota bacterium]|jgi:protein translocase SecG subunit